MGRFVEGEDRRQSLLLPESLDDYVTEDNPVRVVEAFIDELDLGALGFEGIKPAATGRPAYHPSTLLKIYLYGYLNRIQSSRRLEREAQRNMAADTAYGSAENLAWLVHERGIEPHIPVIDKSQRQDGTFERADFAFDHQADAYTCPAGKPLRPRQKTYAKPLADEDGMVRYRASQFDCEPCPLKPRCCPKAPARKILRSVHEGARDMARDIATTAAYVTSRRERKKVEMLFAHLKRILRLDRLRLRGPNGARDEFLLAATAQNLRKMAKLIPLGSQAAPA